MSEILEMLERVEKGLVIYGLMWVMILFLLFLSYIVEPNEKSTKTKNSDQDRPNSDGHF